MKCTLNIVIKVFITSIVGNNLDIFISLVDSLQVYYILAPPELSQIRDLIIQQLLHARLLCVPLSIVGLHRVKLEDGAGCWGVVVFEWRVRLRNWKWPIP